LKINLITLFPEFFDSPFSCGLMQRAIRSGLAEFALYSPRRYAEGSRRNVDDRPYGGGAGMVMLAEPLARALRDIASNRADAPPRALFLSPGGRPFNQELAAELAGEKELTLLCARYEGIDARLKQLFPLEEVSLGDFVLNGGEAAALAVCEAVCRLLPGFMGHDESALEESFSAGLLEHPHYTRPEVYAGISVPEELTSGDHAGIARWRRQQSVLTTLEKRPELLETALLNREEMDWARAAPRRLTGPNLYLALVHYPVLDREQKSVCSSLTNLDIHDIARSSRTYGLGGFFVLTPLEDQRLILREVLDHWIDGPGGRSNPDRREALAGVIPVRNLDEAAALVKERHGVMPALWASSARGKMSINFDEARKILYTRPVILLLGTGHGLAPEIVARCDALLPPLRWIAPYNHLSVRCAGAIMLDRLLGEWG
jgi:tRNA (guanine37-N1)-methyltransferase